MKHADERALGMNIADESRPMLSVVSDAQTFRQAVGHFVTGVTDGIRGGRAQRGSDYLGRERSTTG